LKKAGGLAALIPDTRFVPLESANHILLEAEPAWSTFVSELYRFLDPAAPGVGREARSGRLAPLTRREIEVLDLIARGFYNQAIAQHLVLSPKTVSNHITAIFDKLRVSSRAQAVIAARDAGLGRE
jgi:DNA-binding NarL/FixJ family response regulator